MDSTCRYWFITSTTYGTWLPGDERGFVSNRPEEQVSEWVRNNQLETPHDRDVPELFAQSQNRLIGKPVYLDDAQATAILEQMRETCRVRNWILYTAAVMRNHFHVLLSAYYDVPAASVLRDLKSYASRRLNQQWPQPASGTWWTASGSRRPVYDERGFHEVYRYILEQPHPLALWSMKLDPLDRLS